jgi:hypothetical protein
VSLIPGSPWSTVDGVSQSYPLPGPLGPSTALLTDNIQPMIGAVAFKLSSQ